MKKMKKALITGVSGQDGSYLAELLLEKNYEVYGLNRRKATVEIPNLKDVIGEENFHLIYGDLLEQENVMRLLREIEPDEVYNLAAQSFVKESWNTPLTTCNVNAIGVLRLLEGIRYYLPDVRFYQASSSEQFGNVIEYPQNEKTKFYPCSPYGCSKVMAFDLTRNYRESFGLFCCNGILFNHESPRRGLEFVTRKISDGVARIMCGQQDELLLGNLDTKRDWGHSRDYVKAMWLMLQHECPDDYVVATGETHSVREFVECAFQVVETSIRWEGAGVMTVGVDSGGVVRVRCCDEFYRPVDVRVLQGDSSKVKTVLGWEPSFSFQELVRDMVNYDLVKYVW